MTLMVGPGIAHRTKQPTGGGCLFGKNLPATGVIIELMNPRIAKSFDLILDGCPGG
jgi:hypothetical protein